MKTVSITIPSKLVQSWTKMEKEMSASPNWFEHAQETRVDELGWWKVK